MEKIQSLIKAILQQILSPFLYTAHARGQLSGHGVHSLTLPRTEGSIHVLYHVCFVNTQVELMIWTQKNTLRFATIRLKWKTGLTEIFRLVFS